MSTSEPQVIPLDASVSELKLVDGTCLSLTADLAGDMSLTTHGTNVQIDLAARQIIVSGRAKVTAEQDGGTLTLTVNEVSIVDLLIQEGLPRDLAEQIIADAPEGARLGGVFRLVGSSLSPLGSRSIFDEAFGTYVPKRRTRPFGSEGL